MKSLIAALALIALTTTAGAQGYVVPVLNMRASDFYRVCTNPPSDRGASLTGMCAMYIAGLADGLHHSGGFCVGTQISPQYLFTASMLWIRNHWNYSGREASYMITNGLAYDFPCANGQHRFAHPQTNERQLEAMEKTLRWMEVLKSLLMFFH